MADQHVVDRALAEKHVREPSQIAEAHTEIEQMISATLNGSRDPLRRNDYSDARTFMQLLDTYRLTASGRLDLKKGARRDLVKCICNLAADNDANRQLVIEDSDCLVNLKAEVEAFPSRDSPRLEENEEDAILRANIAVATLFNICNNHEPALQASLAVGLETALLHFISDCLTSSDGNQVALAVDLWTDILAARGDATLKDVDEAYLNAVFNILGTNIHEDELRRDLFIVISTQLFSDVEMQHAVLRNDKLSALCEAFHTVAVGKLQLGDGPTVKRVERALLRCLTDISQLPEYPKSVRLDDRFFPLHHGWLYCDTHCKTMSLAVCALTLLANSITDNESALKVANQIKLDELCESIQSRLPNPTGKEISAAKAANPLSDLPKVSPAEKEYLYTATGFLRQLVPLSSIREIFTTSPTHLDLLNSLLQSSEVDVAEAALQLYNRTLGSGTPDSNLWTRWAMDSSRSEETTSHTLSETMRALHLNKETHIRLRLQIGLVYTSYVRAAMAHWTAEHAGQRNQEGQPDEDSRGDPGEKIATLENTAWETFVPPVFFLVQQESVPRYWVQGLLGLALLTRLPGGAKAVQSCALRDRSEGHDANAGNDRSSSTPTGTAEITEQKGGFATNRDHEAGTVTIVPNCSDFLTILERRINPLASTQGIESTEPGSTGTESATDGGQTESAPAESQRRTRDNATVLLCQLVRSAAVDDARFRAGLKAVAARTGISIPDIKEDE